MQEANAGGSGLGCIVRPCLTDYRRFSFPMALPEQGCVAAAETVTSMCGGEKELGAHGEDPMGSRSSTSQD